MQSSKMQLKDGQTVDLVDGRISDANIASWDGKQDKLTAGTGIAIYRPQPTNATVIEAVHDHTHDNKTVLDGITAEKVAAWDEASGDDWYYLTSSDSRECFYLGYSGENVGESQICTASFIVYLRTLTKEGLFAVNIHTRYSSNVRSFTVRRIDGKGNLNFGLYPVGMTSEPVYRFGYYCCFDAETYCVLKVKPIFLNQYVLDDVAWVTDAATIANVRSNNGKSDDNPYMFRALPRAISLSGGGSNISATGGTWTSTWLAYQSYVFGGGLDITVDFDINLVGQSTYVATLSGADVALCDWSGTAKYTRSVTMPKATYSKQTVSKRCSVRFVVADVGTTFRNGFKIKITLPSNYALDTGAQVNIGGLTVNGTNF